MTVEGRQKIFLAEDDERLAMLVQQFLEQEGYQVTVEHHGDYVMERLKEVQPDLLLLDLMLPGRDGLDICRELQSDFSNPIIIMTSRDADIDQIIGLEVGADDYITKPVNPRLLLARIRAVMRRRFSATENEAVEGQELIFGELKVNMESRTVVLADTEVEMSTTEFDLLWFLAKNGGKTLSRDDILLALRGIEYDGIDRSVDIGISRLRKKLDNIELPSRIKTVRGSGYLFVKDAWVENG